jgi:hypothetical protein
MELSAHVQLADHAVVADGKLFVNGGSWTTRPPDPIPWALALEIKVPWTDNNRTMNFKIELLDADGHPFEVPTPDGEAPLFIVGELRVSAGPLVKPGSQLVGVAAVVLPPLALPPEQIFEWKLWVDDATRDDWRVTFVTGKSQPHA